ncbi:MAG: hypothetical protein H7122_01505 [Chitinophagaceae bacterium]|nr:hypothetical protein [Chitinophagaceae bacterium]
MKTIKTLSIVCLLSAAGMVYCKKDPVPIPSCIQQKIDSIKNSAKRTPPGEVHVWTYGGRKVYLFNAPCCDEFVKVLDENCQYVCSPSGGPLKFGDSLCTDFYQEAKYLGAIFRDDQ